MGRPKKSRDIETGRSNAPATTTPSTQTDFTDDRFMPIKMTTVQSPNSGDGSTANGQQTTGLLFSMFILIIGGLVLLVVGPIGVLVTNAGPVTIGVVSYVATKQINHEWRTFDHAIAVNDLHTVDSYIAFINPFEELWNIFFTLANAVITLWDYIYGMVIRLFIIFIDIFVPLMVFLFQLFWPLFMELLYLAVELLRIFVNLFSQLATDLGPSIQTSGFPGQGPTTTTTATLSGKHQTTTTYPPGSSSSSIPFGSGSGNAQPVVGSASFDMIRTICRFILKLIQVLANGIIQIIVVIGARIAFYIDFIVNVVLKHLPVVFNAVMWMINMFSPDQPLGMVIYSILDLLFRILDVQYGFCKSVNLILKTVCVISSLLRQALTPIASALQINLPLPPKCDVLSMTQVTCHKSPTNAFRSGSFFGVGICDAEVCYSDVSQIITLLNATYPSCDQWTANANDTINCMNVVKAFSNAVISPSAAPIESIAKELCFVLTVTIQGQCSNSLPPFGFSLNDTSYQICIADKSGLVPPQLPFNEGCACIYNAPLCTTECCQQYALHVNGQVQSYIGSYTCGDVLTLFPYQFWCQFDNFTYQDVPIFSDYTFPHTWCNYYEMVVEPLCTSHPPLFLFSQLNFSTVIDGYVQNTCSRTVNQTGVCVMINTTTNAGVINLQYAQTQTNASVLFGINAISSFTGQPIVTDPSLISPTPGPNDMLLLNVNKFFCEQYSLVYKNNNMIIGFQPWSSLYYMSKYCDVELIGVYTGIDLTEEMTSKLRTVDGLPQPISLAGIPANVQAFGGTPLGAAAPSSTGGTLDCGYETGYSPTEVADQQSCVSQTQQGANQAGDATSTNGLATTNSIALNSQSASSALHLGGVNGLNSTVSTQEPLYTIQTTEISQTATVQANPTVWQATPSTQTPDATQNYRTTDGTIPSDATTPVWGIIGRKTLSADKARGKTLKRERRKQRTATPTNEFESIIMSVDDEGVNTEEEEEEEETEEDFIDIASDYSTFFKTHKSEIRRQRKADRYEGDDYGQGEEGVDGEFIDDMSLTDAFTILSDALEKLGKALEIENERIDNDKYSRFISDKRARRGKAIFDRIKNTVMGEHREMKKSKKTDPEKTFKKSREITKGFVRGLLSLVPDDYSFGLDETGGSLDPVVEGYIDQFWLEISNVNVLYSGLTQENYENFIRSQALMDMRYVMNQTFSNLIPNMYAYYYGGNVTDLQPGNTTVTNGEGREVEGDYSFSNGAGGRGQGGMFFGSSPANNAVGANGKPLCKNTIANPYQCCTATATAYECCYGLPFLCFLPMPYSLVSGITTRENAEERWACRDFNSFTKEWYNSIRVFTTVGVNLTHTVLNDEGILFVDRLLRHFTFPGLILPVNPVGCMASNAVYIVEGFALLYGVYIFLTYQLFVEFAIMVVNGTAIIELNNKVAWLQKRLDNAAGLKSKTGSKTIKNE